MPVKKIRFAQEETGRTAAPATPMATKDWEFLNLTPEVVVNPMSQNAELWANSFSGKTAHRTLTAGQVLERVMVWSYVSDFISTGTNASLEGVVNYGTTSLGTIPTTGASRIIIDGISETQINGTNYVVFIVNDQTTGNNDRQAYYYAAASEAGLTFTGDTHTNTTIDNVSSLGNLYVGQLITGTNVATGSRIATISSPSTITLTLATTGTTAGVTFTRSILAKIIDADFPPNQATAKQIVGNMVHGLGGYAMVACKDGTLYTSDLNSLTSWGATQYVSADDKPDFAVGLALLNNTAVVFGANSIEFFQNAGLASGSPLQKIPSMSLDIGAHGNYIGGVFYPDPKITPIITVDGIIYFAGVTGNQGSGEVAIYKMQRPGQATKISYGAINKLLNQAAIGSNLIGFQGAGTMNGEKFIALEIRGSTTYRYLYFPSSGLFWRQNLYTYGMAGLQGATEFAIGTNILYRTDLTTRETGTVTIRTGMDDLGTRNRKFVPKIHVVGDRKASVGTSTLTMYSEDYSHTSSTQSVDLSKVRCFGTRCGSGVDLAVEFSDADTQHVRIKGFDVEYQDGT